jgi:predicted transcriptional regulator
VCDYRLQGGRGAMTTIEVSAEVMATLQNLATARGLPVHGVLAEAISLEVTLVDARRTGSRMLIERRGRLQELIPLQGLGPSQA